MSHVKARYYKADGKKGRARALPDALFDGVVNESVMHQVVKAYLANQRQGTLAAKTRARCRGGSRKPWRQKGTGRARQGTIRAAQWDGGGVAFPPIPHSWRQKLPKKVKALARRSALNDRAENERVVAGRRFRPWTRRRPATLRELSRSRWRSPGKVLILTDGTERERLPVGAEPAERRRCSPFGERVGLRRALGRHGGHRAQRDRRGCGEPRRTTSRGGDDA